MPWQGISSRRTFLSRVTDFLCEVPGLMEDVDILLLRRSQGLDVEVIAENLEDKLRDRVLRLANLLNRWDLEHPFVCREVPLPPGSATSFGMDDKLLFETILWYDNIEFCRTMVGFNAVILLLYSMCDAVGLSEISVAGAGSPDDNHQYTNPIVVPLQGTKAAHALEVCRSVHYIMASPVGSRATILIVFALRIAYRHVAFIPYAAEWIRQVLGFISTCKAFRIADHVLDMRSNSASV